MGKYLRSLRNLRNLRGDPTLRYCRNLWCLLSRLVSLSKLLCINLKMAHLFRSRRQPLWIKARCRVIAPITCIRLAHPVHRLCGWLPHRLLTRSHRLTTKRLINCLASHLLTYHFAVLLFHASINRNHATDISNHNIHLFRALPPLECKVGCLGTTLHTLYTYSPTCRCLDQVCQLSPANSFMCIDLQHQSNDAYQFLAQPIPTDV